MSNKPRRRPAARTLASERASVRLSELKFALRICPPDCPVDPAGDPIPQQLEVDLGAFTLAERQLAKRALAKFQQPPDMEDVVLVHAWVVWRRDHPASSLDGWMEGITFGELLDGLNVDPGRVDWDTTPEGYDPEA